MTKLRTNVIDTSWKPLVNQALSKVDTEYLKQLSNTTNWLPGANNIFNAFSLPLPATRAILFGESPYPRKASANGYAFWDAAVSDIWSETGLTKAVNRATSLRHIIKMLLLADHALTPEDTSQPAIAALDKSQYVQTLDELFVNFQRHGILLLNTSLVLSQDHVRHDIKAWHPFVVELFAQLGQQSFDIHLILLGTFAKALDQHLPQRPFKRLFAEHPYNISFIHNPDVLKYFRPLRLLHSS